MKTPQLPIGAAELWKLERQPKIVHTKIRFTNNPGGQSVLFSGMDCLPGQLDLVATDGQAAEPIGADLFDDDGRACSNR